MICLGVKALLRHQHKGGDAAAADGGGSALIIEIEGALGQTHDGVALVHQKILGVLVVVGRDLNFSADHFDSKFVGIRQTFV